MNYKASLFAAAGFLAAVNGANAGVLYDSSLASPPGVYFGSGNINSGFAVSTAESVEIGLGIVTRYIGPVTPSGNVYNVPTGPTGVAGKTGVNWGFTFSVNLNADGNGGLNLSDITTRLTLQDLGLGTTGSFDLLAIPDNSLYGAGGVCTLPGNCGALSGYYGFQNSEALSFASIAGALGDPAFDMNADDIYRLTLEVFNGTAKLGTDQVEVVAGRGIAVPEPVTLSIFAAGLAAAAATRRRRKIRTARA